MEFQEADCVFRENWRKCALVDPKIKLEELSDEQVDAPRENSVLFPENTTLSEAKIILSIVKKKPQSELVVDIKRVQIVKAENTPNLNRLNTYLLEDEDEYLIDKCNEKTIKEEHFAESKLIVQEKLDIKEEDEEQFTINKVNKREIKVEHFDVPEFITREEIVIKTEDQEEDQSNNRYFDPDYEESRKIFTCKYCYTGLSTEKYKNAHERRCKFRTWKEHLGRSLFECSYCKLLYTREKDKNNHQAVCKKRKDSEKYEENTARKGKRKYCCYKCSFETRLRSNLIRHIRTHDIVKASKYACIQCPYQTIHNSDLKTHLRTHNCFGLICIVCQKSFKHKHNLDAHYVSRHPDRSDKWGPTITNKINECPKCLYKTVITSSFKKHLMTHETPSNQAQFQCNTCAYKCVRKSNLIPHLRIHFGQLPFVCTDCDQRFNSKQQLDGHIIARHSLSAEMMSSITSKVHHCCKCNFKTVRNSNFKNHLKTCL